MHSWRPRWRSWSCSRRAYRRRMRSFPRWLGGWAAASHMGGGPHLPPFFENEYHWSSQGLAVICPLLFVGWDHPVRQVAILSYPVRHAVGSGWVHVQAGTASLLRGCRPARTCRAHACSCDAEHPLTAVLVPRYIHDLASSGVPSETHCWGKVPTCKAGEQCAALASTAELLSHIVHMVINSIAISHRAPLLHMLCKVGEYCAVKFHLRKPLHGCRYRAASHRPTAGAGCTDEAGDERSI